MTTCSHHRDAYGWGAAPLAPGAVGVAVGVGIDNALGFHQGVYLTLIILAGAALWLSVRWQSAHGRGRRWLGFVAAVGLGGMLHESSYRRVPGDAIVRYVTEKPMIVRLSGTVVSQPRKPKPREHFFRRWQYQRDSERFLLAATAIEGREGPVGVSGTVAVKVDGSAGGVQLGDVVTVFGMIRRPRSAANPGQFDYSLWQRRHGIRTAMRVRSAELVTIDEAGGHRAWGWLKRLRAYARSSLIDDTAVDTDEGGTLLETMVLGRRRAVSPRVEELFVRTGTAHYLAVSGAHVGMVALFAWSLGRLFGATRRCCAVAVIVTIILFASIVDPRPPVFRAVIIGVVYCVSVLLRRTASGVNSLSLAAIILLCHRPTVLFEPGFQMSFCGVLAIFYLRQPLIDVWRRIVEGKRPEDDPLRPPPGSRSVSKRSLDSIYRICLNWVAISTAASLASTPFVAAYFGYIAPLGWLASAVLFPFFALTLMLGVMTVAAGVLAPVLLGVLQPASESAAGVLLRVMEKIDVVSPDVRGAWMWVVVLCFMLIVVLLIGWIRVGSTTVWENVRKRLALFPRPDGETITWRVRAALLTTLVVAVGTVGVFASRDEGPPSLRVTALAVGGGASTVIEFPDRTVWLYDCGTNGAYDVGASTIVPFCQTRGIGRIDRVLLTHPNMDHYNGVLSVIDGVSTGPVVVNRHFRIKSPPGGPADAMLDELDRRGHRVEIQESAGESVTQDGVSVEYLWPPDDLGDMADANDSSTVMRLTYAGRSILFCGDIEEPAIAKLLERGGLAADVLVLPHHGSVVANTADFIAAVDPKACVRSSNQHRGSDEMATRLLDAVGGRPVFNTADDGAVTVIMDRRGVRVETYRHGEWPGDDSA